MENYEISLAGSLLICINGVDIKFKGREQKGYCGMVDIWECEFIDNEVNDRCSNDRQLTLLSIFKCQMKIMNFDLCRSRIGQSIVPDMGK